MKMTTTRTVRKPTARALALWRTIVAARSGERLNAWALGGAEKRSARLIRQAAARAAARGRQPLLRR
jgi:hypothetical protein